MEHILQIAIDYHFETEDYDRRVCTGKEWKHREVMPANEEENRLIQIKAREERRKAETRAKEYGYEQWEVGRAISQVPPQTPPLS